MAKYNIKLNADIGESTKNHKIGDDEALMPYIQQANIACGLHGGDALIMQQTIRLATKYKVQIGAHPSFDDKENFGRKRLYNLSHDDYAALLYYQIGAIKMMMAHEGVRLNHVKLHGAWANMAAENSDIATIFVNIIKKIDPDLPIMAMSQTALEYCARDAGQPVICEFFADRAYQDNGTLLDRNLEGAVLHDKTQIINHVRAMLDHKALISINNNHIPATLQSLCVHGDHPNAIDIAKQLYHYFIE